MKTKILLILVLLSSPIFAQQNDSTTVNNSLNKEKEKGIFENDFQFYGVSLGDEKEDYVIRVKNYKSRKGSKRSYATFDIEYGYNYLELGNKTVDPNVEYPDFNFFLSTYWTLSLNGKTRIFSKTSPLFFKYGLGLQWQNYSVKGDYILEKTANGVEYIKQNYSINSSSTKNLYMTVPVMLQLDMSKHGADNGLKMGVGAYGGVRFYSWQKIEFNDADGDKTKVKTRNKYNYNPLNYGLQAEIGYGSFSLNAKYDLSSLFEVDNPYDYQVWRFGIKFAL